MPKLLYINASPRAESVSNQGAQIFVEALGKHIEVQYINLFSTALPEVDDAMTSAKLKFMMGSDMSF